MPELAKLVALSELFDVSVDYLVKDYLEEPETPGTNGEARTQTERLERKVDDLTRYVRGNVYAYDSKTRIFGVSLVSVRFGFARHQRLSRDQVARGIIAIGNVAVGVLAIGFVGAGAISLGFVSVGLLALGAVAFGAAAFGAAAIGIVAVGVSAVGVYAGGVVATGKEIAVGVVAAGKTAVGQEASGTNMMLWREGLTRSEIEAFLVGHNPGLWRPLLRVLSLLGSHIK